MGYLNPGSLPTPSTGLCNLNTPFTKADRGLEEGACGDGWKGRCGDGQMDREVEAEKHAWGRMEGKKCVQGQRARSREGWEQMGA